MPQLSSSDFSKSRMLKIFYFLNIQNFESWNLKKNWNDETQNFKTSDKNKNIILKFWILKIRIMRGHYFENLNLNVIEFS